MRNRLRRIGRGFRPPRSPGGPLSAAFRQAVVSKLEAAISAAEKEPNRKAYVPPFPRLPGESARRYLERLAADELRPLGAEATSAAVEGETTTQKS